MRVAAATCVAVALGTRVLALGLCYPRQGAGNKVHEDLPAPVLSTRTGTAATRASAPAAAARAQLRAASCESKAIDADIDTLTSDMSTCQATSKPAEH
jgi:hypothetical protein